MSEMVERVARRLAPEAWETLERFKLNPPSLDDEALFCGAMEAVPKSISDARAAIETMAEPTVEMCVAGTEDWMVRRASEDRAEAVFKAMIEEALR